MVIKTYTELLTDICDAFDSYIKPYKIRRSETNVLYKILKAIAKGYEVIHNSAALLDNKFQPDKCQEADLVSVAKIAGTKFLSGKSSGLIVYVKNNKASAVTLAAGDYKYSYSDDVSFICTVLTDTEIAAGDTQPFSFYSNVSGAYLVTALSSMTISRVDGSAIDANLAFSCLANTDYIGTPDETPAVFRNRILTDSTRQDVINELEVDLKNLTYISDAKIFFNSSLSTKTIGGVEVPSFYMLIVLNGSPKNEVAEIVAARGIYPTVKINDDQVLKYVNDAFDGGFYPVYYKTFEKCYYDVQIVVTFDQTLITETIIRQKLNEAVIPYKYSTRYKKYVKENTFYSLINDLSLQSVELLDVKIMQNSVEVPYIDVPITQIAVMQNFTIQVTGV